VLFRSPIVVIIDDELPILDVMQIKLQAAGFDVHVADDGGAGWELIQQLLPDVVLADYQMPVLNGVELCQKMLDDPNTREIPVVAFTSRWCNAGADMRDLPNVVEFVHKPFSPRKILDMLARLVDYRNRLALAPKNP